MRLHLLIRNFLSCLLGERNWRYLFWGVRETSAPEDALPEEPPLMGKYYLRTGGCNSCGECCSNLYLVNGDKTIETIAEFEALKIWDHEYASFSPIRTTEHGVLFQCTNLQADKRCGIYENRPSFCRRYPMENTLLMGGEIAKECGYSFQLLKTFQDVLAESQQPQKAPRLKQLLASPLNNTATVIAMNPAQSAQGIGSESLKSR